MSIANELNRITSAKGDIVTAIEAKGVDVPEGTTLDAMSELIDLIGYGAGVFCCALHTEHSGQRADIACRTLGFYWRSFRRRVHVGYRQSVRLYNASARYKLFLRRLWTAS